MKLTSFVAEHGILWFSLGGVMAALDRSRCKSWLVVSVSAPLSILVNFLFKQIVKRPRPEGLGDDHHSKRRVSFSFPSAHATSSFAAATIAQRVEPRLWAPVMSLAGLVAYSRIYLAKHYPFDVAAGAVLGMGLGMLTSRFTGGGGQR